MIYATIPLLVALLCVWLGQRLLTVVVIFAYLSVEGLLKLLSNYNPIVHVGMDIIVLSVAGAWAVEAIAAHRAHIPQLPWVRAIGLYALWIGLELFNPYSPGLVPSLAALKAHLTMIPLYFIVAAVLRRKEDVVRLFVALAVIALVPYVTALVQYTLGPSSVLDLSPRYWQNISMYHEWRPFGTSAVPGGASVFALMVTPLAVVPLTVARLPSRMRWLTVLSLVLAAGTFIVSGVRQAFLGCVLALLVMAALTVSRGRGRGLLAVLLVFVLGFGAYVGIQTFLQPISVERVRNDPRSPAIWRERSVTERMRSLTRAGTYLEARQGAVGTIVRRATTYPFGAGLGRTGSGAGTFAAQLTATAQSAAIQEQVGWADNYFADELTDAGIPGLLIMCTIVGGFLFGAARLARRARDPIISGSAAAIAGLLVTLVVVSWGSQPLLNNPTLAYFWLLAGVLAALRRLDAEARAVPAAAAAAEYTAVA
ncbi:MAG TPA: hypothetical protein VMT21_09570 [Gemmatimonadales bacterium]|nr:hypothetical protein [Gemmatimonadales bacterium]